MAELNRYPIDHLAENGFAVIDLLSGREAAGLHDLCDQYLKESGTDFIASSHFLELEESRVLNEKLHDIIKVRTDELLPGMDLLGGTLATKTRGKSNLVAHRDWTIVDESKYRSYNLWIALVDTDGENGTLGLLPGSHKWDNDVRGLDIENPYAAFTGKLARIGVEPELTKGQAILYDHGLLHYSRPNRTDKPRHVAILGMRDKGAALRLSFRDDDIIRTYGVDGMDYYQMDHEAIKANNELISETAYAVGKLNWRSIRSAYAEHLPAELQQLLEKKGGFIAELLHWRK